MPTLFAFQTTNKSSSILTLLIMSDGTFAGGFGRVHWENGKFKIDDVSANMNGVYTSLAFIKLSGEITKSSGKIGGNYCLYNR